MSTYTYGPPTTGKSVATYPEKRPCSTPGCCTRLSMYNPSQSCWVHEPVTPKRYLSPKRS